MDAEQLSGSLEGSDASNTTWIEWFLSLRGNEFFCEVDMEYIADKFNLAGLNSEVKHYNHAYNLIVDTLEDDLDPKLWDEVEKSARHLYGLIHARFVVTGRGLSKMADKYKRAEFGRCPRVLCNNQATLPVGMTDIVCSKGVKLFCPRCEDVYSPPSRKHAAVDGAYFGTTLPHMLLQVFPRAVPDTPLERYVPKIFGFRLHHLAEVHRKQDLLREETMLRLQRLEE